MHVEYFNLNSSAGQSDADQCDDEVVPNISSNANVDLVAVISSLIVVIGVLA
jgi:hypothetical protein